jgi:hypothetical protein
MPVPMLIFCGNMRACSQALANFRGSCARGLDAKLATGCGLHSKHDAKSVPLRESATVECGPADRQICGQDSSCLTNQRDGTKIEHASRQKQENPRRRAFLSRFH